MKIIETSIYVHAFCVFTSREWGVQGVLLLYGATPHPLLLGTIS